MEGARENVMSVVSVSDPRLASKIGTRTWGTRPSDARSMRSGGRTSTSPSPSK